MNRSPRPRAASAAAAGALGGGLIALFDAVPSVLWLPQWGDRVALIARLFGVLVAVGILSSLLFSLLGRLGRSSRPWVQGAPFAVAAAGPAMALFVSLSRGAQVSAVPGIQLGVVVASAVTVVVVWRLSAPLINALRHAARPWALVPVALALGLALLNRLAYPRHYEAAHAALTACALLCATLGAALALPRLRRGPPVAVWVLLPALLAGSALSSLPEDHDGRAALLSPRAAHARSIMLGVAPLLYVRSGGGLDAGLVAAARRRRRVHRAGGLPAWEQAHLVLITVDALRADHVGAYGYPRRAGSTTITPHLDGLAARGVRFDRAWTPTPRSSYAICSLMTGRALLPRRAARHPTLAEALSQEGFYSAGFYPDGIFFHDGERMRAYRDAELGFSRRDAEYRDADSRTDAALEELDDVVRRGEPRTFLWVHYFDVHEPYEATELGTAPMDRYDSEILKTDAAIGRLLQGLARLQREVVLVVTADHGEEFFEHGGRFHGDSLYEEQLRVPLLVSAPGLAPRGVASPVSLLDVAPTARAMLGLAEVASDGFDLRPLLLGRAFARPPVRATEEGMRALLDWPFKLIEDERVGGLSLFDLGEDPRERRSLASEAPDRVRLLRTELAAFEP
ncbi:MAG: sulfatase [Sandaracinaceae bacterium]